MTRTGAIEKGLAASPAARIVREALGDRDDVWLVGGAVRDVLLDRPLVDLDLATSADAGAMAKKVAGAASAAVFQLSEEFATWRVVSRDGEWRADVAALRGATIEEDLAARDLTVNAMAARLDGAGLTDPHGGGADLSSRTLRAVSERSFEDDPLRLMRAARIGGELSLEPDAGTVALARRSAGRAAEPAGERQFAELRGMLTGAAPLAGLGLLDELGVTPIVLPEVEALRGIQQNPYHHLDVHGHTLAVLEQAIELERSTDERFGESGKAVRELLAEPLADELTHAGGLRFAALLHDIGKPGTRTVNEEGRVMFLGHDRLGAEMIGKLCGRLRTSNKLRGYLEGLTTYHLGVGFLVHRAPLDRRTVFEYLRATQVAPVDVILLTVADRLATQGPKTKPEALEAHLNLARELLPDALSWQREGPPRPPIGGEQLAGELGLEPGPELGRLLDQVAAAAFAGEISTRDEAVALARSRLRR